MKHLWALAMFGLLSATARRAHAGCGFYAAAAGPAESALINDADQVAIFRQGTRLALTMSTNYKGPAEDFAMVVPVPVVLAKEDVKTLEPSVFAHLDRVTAPRVVEYWEQNPCPIEYEAPAVEQSQDKSGGTGAKHKGGGGPGGPPAVTVEAQFISGEYEIVVLGATESDALEKWLLDHQYKLPKGASAALAPYVAEQQKFVVAKVDTKKVKRDAAGAVVLSPLRFVYETPDMRLPVRLGLLNAPTEPGKRQDLIVFVLARRRVEPANYGHAFIPTNVDLEPNTLDVFAGFYAAMFDATMQKAGSSALVTEYAWELRDMTRDPLRSKEVAVLGGDVLRGMTDQSQSPDDLVVTRLHTRYDQKTLAADIVFKLVDPVVGGREDDGASTVAAPSENNGFSARYAVRHEWFGNITCADPKRGVWTGPPTGKAPRGIQAVDTAAAPRDVAWASYVKSPVHALGVKLSAPAFGAAPKMNRSGQWLDYYGPRVAAALVAIGLAVATFVIVRRARRAR